MLWSWRLVRAQAGQRSEEASTVSQLMVVSIPHIIPLHKPVRGGILAGAADTEFCECAASWQQTAAVHLLPGTTRETEQNSKAL